MADNVSIFIVIGNKRAMSLYGQIVITLKHGLSCKSHENYGHAYREGEIHIVGNEKTVQCTWGG